MVTAQDISEHIGVTVTGLIPTELIDSEEKLRIIDVIGQTAFDAIEADMASGGDYEVVGGYLKSALIYYVAAEIVMVMVNRPDERGIFNLNAETARSVNEMGIDETVKHYRNIANRHLQMAIELIEEKATAWTMPELQFKRTATIDNKISYSL
jgi:hypothetical protein